MVSVIIHRGSREIGGTCIELSSGDTRILLDIGMPLVNPDGSEFCMRDHEKRTGPQLKDKKILPCVDGLYHWETPSVDAILISHAHQDHYGFLSYIHPDIPVYMSAGTQKLIEITAEFTGKDSPCRNKVCFSWPSQFHIGAFTITPHLVDHSSFSAFAFEIEAEGKRIFYSGDFRDHGYLGRSLDHLYAHVAPGVDALFLEGTMLGREEGRVQSEEELSREATEICRETEKAVFVWQSGQNISRAVSFYKAAKRSGRLFILDVYTAHVLSELAKGEGGANLPCPGKPGFENVRVWYPRFLTNRLFDEGRSSIPYRHHRHKVSREEMAADLGKVMLFVRPHMDFDLRRLPGIQGSTLVYSLWQGYKGTKTSKEFLDTASSLGVRIVDLHTSGHADLHALQRMAYKLQPKCIVPVHTFHREKYRDLFPFPIAEMNEGCLVI